MRLSLLLIILLPLLPDTAAAQEPSEVLQEINEELSEAIQNHERLKRQVEFSGRRVELLTEIRRLHQQFERLEEQIGKAEDNDDERKRDQLEEQLDKTEFQIDFLRMQQEVLERRTDLTELTNELPSDNKVLQAEGKRLHQMVERFEELNKQLFKVYREGPEQQEGQLEDQLGELEESFEYRREVLGLKLDLHVAREEDDEEWAREIEAELKELGEAINGKDAEDIPRQSFNIKDMPPPMEFTDQELARVGQMDFDGQVVPLLKAACFRCHDANSASGDLNLENLIRAKPIVVNRNHWVNVIQQLKVRSMPPADADQPSEQNRRIMAAWLTNAIENFDYDKVKQPGYELARRLTHEEYNNTVRDLVGIDIRPAGRFPADMTASSGFENSANSLFIQPVLLERYLGAAEQIAETAWPDNPVTTKEKAAWKLLLHDAEDLSDTEAVKRVLSRFASRAFRRPLRDGETDRLLKHFDRQIRNGHSPKAALKDVLQVVLVSPGFLIRTEDDGPEAGKPFRISDWNLASRLSYFLWASMPDDELFRLAEQNRLHQADVLTGQVDRMLRDPRAMTLGTVFAAQWLGFANLDRVQRDQIDNPWATDSLVEAMRLESAALFHSLVRDNQPLDRLIDADYTFMNEELARHYRMEGISGRQLQKVSLAKSPRQGILGHGSILAVTSFPGRTSPVVRGNWILSELLGTPPPPPPPNVSQFDERVADNDRLTQRQKLELHRDNPNCYGCHSQIDPLGFALEQFAWFGQHREERRERPIDTSAQLPNGRRFTGLKGLCNALLEERMDDLTTQVTRKMLAYALGRQLEYYDEATVRELVQQMQTDDRRMQSLIHGIVQSDTFNMKQK